MSARRDGGTPEPRARSARAQPPIASRPANEAAGAIKTYAPGILRATGWHLLGTARMGDDPSNSVVDQWGRSHDVPNLYVLGGSTFVTCSGLNPTATVCAVALRSAEHAVENRRLQQAPA
jgi:choline dehydrogenase-like flavoprotein